MGTTLSIFPQSYGDQLGGHGRKAIACGNAQQAADGAGGTRFDDELPHDVAAFGPQGLSNADLPCPFSDGDQHDIHNADAAYHQGDGGNAGEAG